MSTVSLPMRLALCAALCVSAVSCASTETKGQPPVNDVVSINGQNVYQWWNNPDDLGDGLYAIGSSPTTRNISMTRTAATVNGRARLAAILSAEIQSLTELWAQDTGDLEDQDSMQSLYNNETFTRQIVNTNIRGARAKMFHDDNGTYYALVGLEDPATFQAAVKAQVEENFIKDETYFKTEVRKDAARKSLDALLEKQTADIAKARSGL